MRQHTCPKPADELFQEPAQLSRGLTTRPDDLAPGRRQIVADRQKLFLRLGPSIENLQVLQNKQVEIARRRLKERNGPVGGGFRKLGREFARRQVLDTRVRVP